MAQHEHHEHDDARSILLRSLLRRVADDPFPSTTMLDMIEDLLRPDEVSMYVALLVRKIDSEVFPSIPMLQRLAALAE
ncbi:hypothetical protein [Kribbella pratensis]|jgi:hypothetical protein|uniref:Uncharacterized protein n=1 Tax=Kribbella pratensis TaxID=2512112 RepID=A0A4R8C132_9ACTN|nr:hypothetical protein [Kribbella pratensis]TDW69386.1 hypothetical protein EV653_3410 [Kribbella pratensis]